MMNNNNHLIMAVLHGVCSRMITVLLCAVILCWAYRYLLCHLPINPTFCDNLLQTETRLWEILVMLSMRYKFLKRNSIQLLVLFNSYR